MGSGKIFINYRRSDSQKWAVRLYDHLARKFGRDRVFMDIDSTPAGVDFVSHISAQIAQAGVFLALIGERWLSAANEAGGRRLDDPDDFVRSEIEAALARNILVAPVLLDGAAMPRAAQLPPSLAPLARRHALPLTRRSFQRDARKLTGEIETVLGPAASREAEAARRGATGRRTFIRRAGAAALVGAPLLYLSNRAGIDARLFDSSSRVYRLSRDEVYSVAISPDNARILSGGDEGVLTVWNVDRGRIERRLAARAVRVNSVAFAPDGRHALSRGQDGALLFWDVETGETVWTLEDSPGGVSAVLVDREGRRGLSTRFDGRMALWDLERGAVITKRQTAFRSLRAIAATPTWDRLVLAGVGTDDTARLEVWDGATLQMRRALIEGPANLFGVHAVALSPDGARIVSVAGAQGEMGALAIWNADTGERVGQIQGETEIITALAITPDGTRAISSGGDFPLTIWDLETGAALERRYGHTGWVQAAAVSADGRYAVSGGVDQTIRLWEI